VTTTIESDDAVADEPLAPASSAVRSALVIALATTLFLAAAAGVVFVVVHKTPPAPAPVAQQAPVPPAPSATPTPDEQFLDAWHQVAPGVAARRSDNTWTQIGISTCGLIGIPGATPDVLSRTLGSNPTLMSVTEANQLLGVANAKLCPEKVYVAGPTLVLPKLPSPSLPDFGNLSAPSGHSSGSGWIPTRQVSPPAVHAPAIPGTGNSGSSSSAPSSGGHTNPPSIIKSPPKQLEPQPIYN
jgi:hypothetical protein